jgi:Ca-activated chloride channel family protein
MTRTILFFLVFTIMACDKAPSGDNRFFTSIAKGYPGVTPSSANEENPFIEVAEKAESVFGVDVDTASYTLTRAHINSSQRPTKSELRTEEFVNYFNYTYPEPGGMDPVGFHFETAQAPWNRNHRLVKIGMKARAVSGSQVPPLNLVFLIDVSGSMEWGGRLNLVKKALGLLVTQLRPQDKISIVTYNESIQVRIEGVSGSDKAKINGAIDGLFPGGGTAGGPGIQKAYEIAYKYFVQEGVNRVVLSTDGDFNVGIRDPEQLKNFVQDQASKGVTITVHGYGMGNYNDQTLEKIADAGNGNYAYIDYLGEADKVFRMQLLGTLLMVAKDVKLKVEFNPQTVKSYRLIGYENRLMTGQDFDNDFKDSGDMGSGHTVTAFYEIVPKPASGRLFDLSVRYKEPTGGTSRLIQSVAYDAGKTLEQSSDDFRFAAAAAWFALMLGESQYIGSNSLAEVENLANGSRGADSDGLRAEFVELVKRTRTIPTGIDFCGTGRFP